MPLVLTRRDLQKIFEDPAFLEEAFQIVQNILVASSPVTFLAATLPDFSGERALRVEVRGASNGVPYVGLRLCSAGGMPAAGIAEVLVSADGSLLALASAEVLDSWRVAMPTGLAARYLAPAGARSLGVYGTDARAWACLYVLALALPSLSLVRIYSRDRAAASELARAAVKRTGLVVTVEDEPYLAAGADVVTVLGDERPIEPDWLADDVLLIRQALDGIPPGLEYARIVETTRCAGEACAHDQVRVTLADIVCGRVAARPHAGEPAVYRAGGLPGWDSAMYGWALRCAWRRDMGQRFRLD